jgi:hypothetical protein
MRQEQGRSKCNGMEAFYYMLPLLIMGNVVRDDNEMRQNWIMRRKQQPKVSKPNLLNHNRPVPSLGKENPYKTRVV